MPCMCCAYARHVSRTAAPCSCRGLCQGGLSAHQLVIRLGLKGDGGVGGIECDEHRLPQDAQQTDENAGSRRLHGTGRPCETRDGSAASHAVTGPDAVHVSRALAPSTGKSGHEDQHKERNRAGHTSPRPGAMTRSSMSGGQNTSSGLNSMITCIRRLPSELDSELVPSPGC